MFSECEGKYQEIMLFKFHVQLIILTCRGKNYLFPCRNSSNRIILLLKTIVVIQNVIFKLLLQSFLPEFRH